MGADAPISSFNAASRDLALDLRLVMQNAGAIIGSIGIQTRAADDCALLTIPNCGVIDGDAIGIASDPAQGRAVMVNPGSIISAFDDSG